MKIMTFVLIILSLFVKNQPNHINEFGNSVSKETSVKPASVFQSNMVLQADMPVRIWGTAIEGTIIQVSLGKHTKKTVTDSSNKWIVAFSPLSYSKNPLALKINDDYCFNNILIGEVWICAGQSNMQFGLNKSENYSHLLPEDYNENIRLLQYNGIRIVAKDGFTENELNRCNINDYFKGEWVKNQNETALDFSAVGWYFGNHINKSIDKPVGLISIAVGGSALNNWIPSSVLKRNPLTQNLFEKDWLTNPEVKIAHRIRAKEAFQSILNKDEPYIVGQMPYRWICEPGFIFDAGLAPLINLSFRGIIWYQGESDSDTGDRYKKLFPLMADSWRNYFDNGKFPILFVQLPGYNNKNWPYFREVQKNLAQSVPNTKMAVAIDLGIEDNIHPPDKAPIGYRLSKLALKYVYGEKILADSPEPDHVDFKKNRIILNFKNMGAGFQKLNGDIQGFEIADQSGNYHKVKTELFNSSAVILHFDAIKPSKIRYAWTPFPKPYIRLYNSGGIPLGPFIFNL